jgi:hypothetical protein
LECGVSSEFQETFWKSREFLENSEGPGSQGLLLKLCLLVKPFLCLNIYM